MMKRTRTPGWLSDAEKGVLLIIALVCAPVAFLAGWVALLA